MKKVLLVEDSVQDVELAREAFDQATNNVEMVVAGDGIEALSYLENTLAPGQKDASPVMVLLDIKMPRMGGLELLERIKTDLRLQNIPVVMFSSSMENTDLQRGYKLGANSYVVKPVNFTGYLAAIDSISRFWVDTNQPVPA